MSTANDCRLLSRSEEIHVPRRIFGVFPGTPVLPAPQAGQALLVIGNDEVPVRAVDLSPGARTFTGFRRWALIDLGPHALTFEWDDEKFTETASFGATVEVTVHVDDVVQAYAISRSPLADHIRPALVRRLRDFLRAIPGDVDDDVLATTEALQRAGERLESVTLMPPDVPAGTRAVINRVEIIHGVDTLEALRDIRARQRAMRATRAWGEEVAPKLTSPLMRAALRIGMDPSIATVERVAAELGAADQAERDRWNAWLEEGRIDVHEVLDLTGARADGAPPPHVAAVASAPEERVVGPGATPEGDEAFTGSGDVDPEAGRTAAPSCRDDDTDWS